jgi:hypothetical protein
MGQADSAAPLFAGVLLMLLASAARVWPYPTVPRAGEAPRA